MRPRVHKVVCSISSGLLMEHDTPCPTELQLRPKHDGVAADIDVHMRSRNFNPEQAPARSELDRVAIDDHTLPAGNRDAAYLREEGVVLDD